MPKYNDFDLDIQNFKEEVTNPLMVPRTWRELNSLCYCPTKPPCTNANYCTSTDLK